MYSFIPSLISVQQSQPRKPWQNGVYSSSATYSIAGPLGVYYWLFWQATTYKCHQPGSFYERFAKIKFPVLNSTSTTFYRKYCMAKSPFCLTSVGIRIIKTRLPILFGANYRQLCGCAGQSQFVKSWFAQFISLFFFSFCLKLHLGYYNTATRYNTF